MDISTFGVIGANCKSPLAHLNVLRLGVTIPHDRYAELPCVEHAEIEIVKRNLIVNSCSNLTVTEEY